MTLLMLSLLTSANAQDLIEAWAQDEWAEGTISGEDDWESGYDGDGWYGGGSTGYAYSLSDDNGGTFGGGDAADNWLVNYAEPLQDAVYEFEWQNEDNDSIGVVFNHNGRDTFYIVFHTADSAPDPQNSSDGGAAFLWRVDRGTAEELDVARLSLETYAFHDVEISVNDGEIVVTIDGDEVLSATDDDPLDAGYAGLYAYDAGYDGGGGGNTNAFFSLAVASWLDSDEDGVPDDLDNCEDDANPGQEDEDGDEVGNACDDDYEPPDTDTNDTDSPSDTESDTESDDDINERPSLDTGIAVGCGCASQSGGAALWLLAPALLLLRRRR